MRSHVPAQQRQQLMHTAALGPLQAPVQPGAQPLCSTALQALQHAHPGHAELHTLLSFLGLLPALRTTRADLGARSRLLQAGAAQQRSSMQQVGGPALPDSAGP